MDVPPNYARSFAFKVNPLLHGSKKQVHEQYGRIILLAQSRVRTESSQLQKLAFCPPTDDYKRDKLIINSARGHAEGEKERRTQIARYA